MKTFILNWKSFGNLKIAENFLLELSKLNLNHRIILAFPLIYAFLYKKYEEDLKKQENEDKIFFCSQDISCFEDETKTGEINPKMLMDFNIKYALVGHFERRFYLNENNKIIAKKLYRCFSSNILPIICFGEDFDKRISLEYKNFLQEEIFSILDILKKIFAENNEILNNFIKSGKKIIFAYEPIWCIGKNVIPTFAQVDEVFNIFKSCCKNREFSDEIVQMCYGGSVNEKNALNLAKDYNINTFLIGKAGCNIESFRKILEAFI